MITRSLDGEKYQQSIKTTYFTSGGIACMSRLIELSRHPSVSPSNDSEIKARKFHVFHNENA